jgi:hypothetical protein
MLIGRSSGKRPPHSVVISLFWQLLSAAGVGGLSWVPAATGTDAAAHAKYRPDIDGLRAVAVLPVRFYHVGISLTPRGFVGVDVFFVISGYLITGLISAEMHEGTYSIRNFYVRRARRIFPALFVMCAVTALFVLLVCLPSDTKHFSGSLAAATLFGSNIYFRRSLVRLEARARPGREIVLQRQEHRVRHRIAAIVVEQAVTESVLRLQAPVLGQLPADSGAD